MNAEILKIHASFSMLIIENREPKREDLIFGADTREACKYFVIVKHY